MVSPVVQLGLGEMYIGSKASLVEADLESCVAVCLYCPELHIGGIVRFAVPDRNYPSNFGKKEAYLGEEGIRLLHQKICQLVDLKKFKLKAKIAGGAQLGEPNLGSKNLGMARRVLGQLHVSIAGEHVGGNGKRKIFFYTDSGRLRVSTSSPVPHAEPAPKTKGLGAKIKVLVVDDSKTIRDLLGRILKAPDIEVVGAAANTVEAEQLIFQTNPDVVTLDINMPGMDGVTYLEQLLPRKPIPVVMVTSVNLEDSGPVFRALELGAVDYIQKPNFSEIEAQSESIREKIRIASQVKVKVLSKSRKQVSVQSKAPSAGFSIDRNKIIFIGSSTGGTEALREVLTRLPEKIPPILIVQHIPPVFSTAFAKRLNDLCPFEVLEAYDGAEVKPGCVLIAPGDRQMVIQDRGGKLTVRVYDGDKVNLHKPSVDVLFFSAAEVARKNAIGVILTGMGADGAKGLLKMKEAGARTFCQDEATCVVYGMPKAAVELNACDEVSPLDKISDRLMEAWSSKKAA